MTTFIQSSKAFFFLICCAFFFSACNPCDTTVCDNGACDNGKCVCDAGYFLNNDNCAALNLKYIGSGTVNASQSEVDSQGNSSGPSNVNLTLNPSSVSPYAFTLARFKNFVKNDIEFIINDSDSGILNASQVTTSAGNTYNVSGSKSGFQVTLIISEPSGSTYTLQYGA